MTDWFTAHKQGLRDIADRQVEARGFGIVGGELYQNVMDESDATECVIFLEKLPNKSQARLMCSDNGSGFTDLSHAWTMFAPSEKKGDPTKAGRFNLGEKMVLAFCRSAEIATTSGTVSFDDKGRKEFPRRKMEVGTVFKSIIDCTQERYDQFIEYMSLLLIDADRGLNVTVNNERIAPRTPIHEFECKLPTQIGDNLRPSQRITTVKLYEPLEGEVPSLYELGIPVVETGDKWHVNIMQKVPLNIDRDNVTPSYLNKVRVAVMNEMHAYLSEDDSQTAWVNEAASDSACSDEAAETFRVKRFGEKSIAFDPSDQEANNRATAAGYQVIPSRGLTPGQRDNLKRAGTLKSSSALFPTSKPYSDDPNAPPVQVVSEDKWTSEMKNIYEYTTKIGAILTDGPVHVRFVNTRNNFGACCGPCRGFDYNIMRLSKRWFKCEDDEDWERVDQLIIHELAHIRVSNHLSDDFHKECCRLGAKLKRLALNDPDLFKSFRK